MRAYYQTSDFGCERAVHLVDAHGRDIVPPRDPFWPAGIPLGVAERDAKLRDTLRAMLVDAAKNSDNPQIIA